METEQIDAEHNIALPVNHPFLILLNFRCSLHPRISLAFRITP